VSGLARRLASAPLALLLLANAPDGLDAAVARWLDAFNRLDWPAFRAAFAPDATVFHPSPADGAGRRVEPADLDRAWLAVLASLKARSGRNAPPYLSIMPRDLRVDRLSADAALVTFHLGADPWPGRRTVVWRRDAIGWRIVHLHASRLPPPAETP
jgi:ketosteroid isomerase-like protein